MAEFRMPSLGADMEVGTILQWLVKPGDAVKRGDIVAVVDTEKATIEIEVFQSGVIDRIVVPEGEQVPVGTLIAVIRTDGEVAAPPAPVAVPTPPAPAAPPHRLRISPLAMRVAVDLKVDLSKVKGTGPDGAITKADVERAAKAAKEAPAVEALAAIAPAVAKAPPARPAAAIDHHVAMRRVIAASMGRSRREIQR